MLMKSFLPQGQNQLLISPHQTLDRVDMRKVFDDKDIHANILCHTHFWHALGTIWACQAGKHVYVEKTMLLQIFLKGGND